MRNIRLQSCVFSDTFIGNCAEMQHRVQLFRKSSKGRATKADIKNAKVPTRMGSFEKTCDCDKVAKRKAVKRKKELLENR